MEVEGIDLADTDISALKRPILQRICKALGYKAAGKNKDLVHKLKDHVRVHATFSPAKIRSASGERNENDAVDKLEVARLSVIDQQTKHEGNSTSLPFGGVQPLQAVHANNANATESEHDLESVSSKTSPFYYPFESAKPGSRLGAPLKSDGNCKDVLGEKENCRSPCKTKKENFVVASAVSVKSSSTEQKTVNFTPKPSKRKAQYRSPRIEINGTPVRGTPQRCRVSSEEAIDDNDDGVEFHDASDSWNHLDQELATRLTIASEDDACTPSAPSSPSPATEVFVDAMTPGTLLRSIPFRGLMTSELSPKPVFKLPTGGINEADPNASNSQTSIAGSTPNLKKFDFPFGDQLTHFPAETPQSNGSTASIADSYLRVPHTTGKVRVRKVAFTASPPPGRRIARPRSKSKSPVPIPESEVIDVSTTASGMTEVSIGGISNESFCKATETVLREMARRVSDTMKMPENERAKLYPHILKSTEKNHSPGSHRKINFDNIHRKTFLGFDSISNHYAAKRTAKLKSSGSAHTSGAGSSDGIVERKRNASDESVPEFTEKNKRRSAERFMSVGVKKIKLDRNGNVSSDKTSVTQKSHTSNSKTNLPDHMDHSQPAIPDSCSKTTPGKHQSQSKRIERSFSPYDPKKFTPSKSSASPLLQRTLVRLAALKSNDHMYDLLKARTNKQDMEADTSKNDVGGENVKNVDVEKPVGSPPADSVSLSLPAPAKPHNVSSTPKPNVNQRKLVRSVTCASKGSRNVLKDETKVMVEEIKPRGNPQNKTERNLVDMTPAQKDTAKLTYVTDTVRRISKEIPPKTVIRVRSGPVLPVYAPSTKQNRTRAKSLAVFSSSAEKTIQSPENPSLDQIEMEKVVEQLEMISVRMTETLPSTPVVRPNEVRKGIVDTTTKGKITGKSTRTGDYTSSAVKARSMGKCVTFVPNSPASVQAALGATRQVKSSAEVVSVRKSPFASPEIKKSNTSPSTPKSLGENAMFTPSAKKTAEPGFLRSTKSSLLKCQKPMSSLGPVFNALQLVNRPSVPVPPVSAKKPATVPCQTIRSSVTTRVTRSQIPARAKKDVATTAGNLQQTAKPTIPSRINKLVEQYEQWTADDTIRKSESKKIATSPPGGTQRRKFDITASLARPLSYRPHTGRLTVVPSPKSLATGEASATKQQRSVTPDGDTQGKKRAPVRSKTVPKQKVPAVEPLASNTALNASAPKAKPNKEEFGKSRKSVAAVSVRLVETERKIGRGLAMSTRSKTSRVGGSEKEKKTTRVPVAKLGRAAGSVGGARAK